MGFNNMWILLNDVLPRAIQKHGGFGPEALAKAARETDIPEGGTMQGYGVKFTRRGQSDSPARTSAPSPRCSRSSRASSSSCSPRPWRPPSPPAAAGVLAACGSLTLGGGLDPLRAAPAGAVGRRRRSTRDPSALTC